MGMSVNSVGMTPSRAVSCNQATAFTGKKAKAENAAADVKQPSKAKKAAKIAGLSVAVLATAATVVAAFAGGKANKSAGVTFDGNFLIKNAKKLGSNIQEGYRALYKGAAEALGSFKNRGREVVDDIVEEAEVVVEETTEKL